MRHIRSGVLRAHFADLGIGREILGAVVVFPVDHHALAVLQRRLADEAAEGRLVVDLAELDRAERAAELEALHRRDQLLAVERLRLADRVDGGVPRAVAARRAQAARSVASVVTTGAKR